MDQLSSFLNSLNTIVRDNTSGQLTIEQARKIIKEINEFLYTNYDNIGTTCIFGEDFNYLSDFHKYWHDNYEKILNIQIVESQCKKVAIALHDIWKKTGGATFQEVYDTYNLSKEDICRIRFLTANQDFRGSRSFEQLTKVFLSDKSIFDERKIYADPEWFIKAIGITSLSQNDKRILFAKNAAKLLIDFNTSPFNFIEKFNNNVLELRTALTDNIGLGYGNKKTDMFIRDMVVLGVWKGVQNFDKIDVASDINTIKVALRTGIMKSEIPLVSSFLDIFCYQYGYVDEMNAKSWRKVWELWLELFPKECIDSPCLMDYFIYKVVGKQFCKEILYSFCCNDKGHQFKWHSWRNKTCQTCYKENNIHAKATLIGKYMPCIDDQGYIAIQATEFVSQNKELADLKACPFKQICLENGTLNLQPPKSISIMGQTGWTTAYTKKGEGGGGLMA